jgi:hypothetical protein
MGGKRGANRLKRGRGGKGEGEGEGGGERGQGIEEFERILLGNSTCPFLFPV